MTTNGKEKIPDTPQPQSKKILSRPPINNSKPNWESSLNDSIHAPNDWADKSEHLHPNPKGYAKPINDINDREQPDRMDLLMNKLDAVSTQLGRLHEDLQFTNERVSTMEALLKIYSTSPKQAAIINAQPTDDNMEDEDYIVRPGIDVSESVITTQNIDIKTLQDENSYLKRNLQANVDKLNEALKVVDIMQQLMINAGQLHESRRIPVATLEKPNDFYDEVENSTPQQTQL
jgi:hypothetical protein